MEIRLKSLEVETRDDGSYSIGGYVNVTERESELLYSSKRSKWFNEVVKRGAFTRSITCGKEIPLLLEHDEKRQLASTSNSLTLKEDQIGLRFDAEIRDKDVYEKVKSKQINNCSFGFIPVEEEFEVVDSVREKRYLKDLELLEISLVENPAYAGSLVEVRNMNEQLEERKKQKNKSEDKPKNEPPVDDDDSDEDDVVEDKSDDKDDSKEYDSDDKNEPDDKDDLDESDNKDDDKKKKNKKEEERGYVEEQIAKAQETVTNPDSDGVIDEIIKEKEEELAQTEFVESIINEDLKITKQCNRMQEECIEEEAIRASAQVLKLRVQLLKLKNL